LGDISHVSPAIFNAIYGSAGQLTTALRTQQEHSVKLTHLGMYMSP